MTRAEAYLAAGSWLIGIAFGIAISLAALHDDLQSTAPVALAPAADTTVVYRTILIGPPRPDTTLRYECKEAK